MAKGDPLGPAIEHLNTLDPEARKAALTRIKLQTAPFDPDAPLEIVRTMGEYWDTDMPVPPVLIEPGLIVRGALTVTAGRAGKGKTQLNLNRCMRWACGLPFFDTLPDVMVPTDSKPLRIGIIENEGSGGMFWKQTRTMYDHATFDGHEQIRDNLLIWGDGGYANLKLDKPEHIEWISRAMIEKHEPDIVMMEPFRALHRGNENDSQEVAAVLDVAEGLASEYGIAILLAHHETKHFEEGADLMNRLRGSGAFEGTAATIEHHSSVSRGKYRELDWSKVRYAPMGKPAPVRMAWDGETFWYSHVAESALTRAVLTLLTNSEDPVSIADMASETGETQARIRTSLEGLIEDGSIKATRNPSGPGRAFRIVHSDNGDGLSV